MWRFLWGGTVLSVAGLADEADARMFSTYAESSTINMLLGGLAPVEEKAVTEQWNAMTEEELNEYRIVAEYCYNARIIQIEKLISSGAVSLEDSIRLEEIRTELMDGLESLENHRIGVVE